MRYWKAAKYSHVVLEGETRTFCNQREVLNPDEVTDGLPNKFPGNLCPVCESRLNVVWRWQRAERVMSDRVGAPAQLLLYTEADDPPPLAPPS